MKHLRSIIIASLFLVWPLFSDVVGGPNLKTSGRLVVVLSGSAVTEAAGCVYDSQAKRLICDGGFQPSSSNVERGRIIFNELLSNGNNQMVLFGPESLSSDKCIVFADDAPQSGDVLRATSQTVSVTVDVDLPSQKVFTGCRIVSWEPLPIGEGGGIVSGVESIEGRTGVVTLSDLYADLNHDHSGVYVPVSRTITGSGPISGGGDLTTNRTLTLAPCPEGQIYKYISGQWTCSADGGGGGGSVNSVDGRTGDVTLGDLYSPFGHNHDGAYADIDHNHTGVYEPADATITKSTGVRTAEALIAYS